ncbi:MAG: AAA family ATPase [Bacteroidetes bacterium]|nr:AAA family ATPase [Bacteroidota bacterium]
MKPIVLLSGPPGAGKTTVAKELVKISQGSVAYIEGDKFWSFFVKGWEGAGTRTNFRTIMRSVTATAIPYALNGYETIVDFSIPPRFLETALKMANFREVPLHYAVIRPDQHICARRASSREEGPIKDYAHLEEFYASFDPVQKYIIYDNEGDAATIAGHIREGLDEGIFKVEGSA